MRLSRSKLGILGSMFEFEHCLEGTAVFKEGDRPDKVHYISCITIIYVMLPVCLPDAMFYYMLCCYVNRKTMI
jgi:hypothetical protein